MKRYTQLFLKPSVCVCVVMCNAVVIESECHIVQYEIKCLFLDPEGGSQKATLVVVVVIGSLKIPKAFLICSRAQ